MKGFEQLAASERERFFPGQSEMAQRMRSFDWSRSELGPPETWPQNLKTSVRIILTSQHPMFVWWGERLFNLYNDGYAAFLCAKHPAALSQPASAVWPEIWEQVGPRAELAMHCGEGTYDEALPFIMLRNGYPRKPMSPSLTVRSRMTAAASAAFFAPSPMRRNGLSVSGSGPCFVSWPRELQTCTPGKRHAPKVRALWKATPVTSPSRSSIRGTRKRKWPLWLESLGSPAGPVLHLRG